jgi:hypothetical protein
MQVFSFHSQPNDYWIIGLLYIWHVKRQLLVCSFHSSWIATLDLHFQKSRIDATHKKSRWKVWNLLAEGQKESNPQCSRFQQRVLSLTTEKKKLTLSVYVYLDIHCSKNRPRYRFIMNQVVTDRDFSISSNLSPIPIFQPVFSLVADISSSF